MLKWPGLALPWVQRVTRDLPWIYEGRSERIPLSPCHSLVTAAWHLVTFPMLTARHLSELSCQTEKPLIFFIPSTGREL